KEGAGEALAGLPKEKKTGKNSKKAKKQDKKAKKNNNTAARETHPAGQSEEAGKPDLKATPKNK
ncbi:MAG: hypothetical protein ACI4BG_05415, partial [Prevotella sp.]